MRRFVSAVAGFCAFACAVTGFTACGGDEGGHDGGHTHDFTGAYVQTEGGHARECAAEGCAEVSANVEPHGWVADTDKTDIAATCHSDGTHYIKCSDCGAESREAVTQRPEHDFSGEWIDADDGINHYKICINDGCSAEDEKVAHDMRDVEEITPPDVENDGIMKTRCNDCGYESTRTVPALNHVKGNGLIYDNDGSTHWYECSVHDDCGVKFEESAHEFLTELPEEGKGAACNEDGYSVWACVCGAKERRVISKDTVAHVYEGQTYVKDGENGHYRECSVCATHSQTDGHVYGDGEITLKPTFWNGGEKTVACEYCGHTKTESIAALNKVDYKDEFSVENNPNGSWSYGTVTYKWGDKEDFIFTPLTDKTGDAWIKGNLEIKDSFINTAEWAVVAYNFKEAVNVNVNFKFTGTVPTDEDGNRLTDGEGNIIPQSKFNCRIGVKNAEGAIYANPEFVDGEVSSYIKTLAFNAGDTVYFMIEHAGTGWSSGNINLTITKVA